MKERIGYFQNNEVEKYIECVKGSHQEYAEMIKEATTDALKFLNIDETDYEQSFILARANPDIME